MDQQFNGKAIWKTNGETVIHVCAEYNAPDLLDWFHVNYECDLNAENNAGETPLMVAAREGKIEVVRLYVT